MCVYEYEFVDPVGFLDENALCENDDGTGVACVEAHTQDHNMNIRQHVNNLS